MLARFLLLGLLITWVGCGPPPHSSSTTPVASEPGTAEGAEVEASAPPGESAAATDPAQTAAMLQELTQAVRKYSVDQRRVPESLGELVAHGYLNELPNPPAGQQFAISKNLQVYLTDR